MHTHGNNQVKEKENEFRSNWDYRCSKWELIMRWGEWWCGSGDQWSKNRNSYLGCRHTTSLNSTIRENKRWSPCTHAFIFSRLTVVGSLSSPSNLKERKTSFFPAQDFLHDPTGSHKNSTGYNHAVYKIGKEQFQREKHRGWLHQVLWGGRLYVSSHFSK